MTIQQTSPGAAISLSGVTVEPVSGRIGAIISGLDISEPLDDAAVELVQQALDTWKVVFFRGQELDHASQIAFGRRFGRLTYAHPHDNAPPDGGAFRPSSASTRRNVGCGPARLRAAGTQM
jgi:alpha-ketoglutarate-dependent taurine dioxygenase